MNKVNIKKSFLLSGVDFPVTKSLSVKHPTVQEVLDIDKENNGYFSEDIYYSWVSVFICEPYDYMVYLDDKGIDYESIDKFDLFIMLYEDMTEKYLKLLSDSNADELDRLFMDNIYFRAFNFFLDMDTFVIAKTLNGEVVIADPVKNTAMIDREIFEHIAEFIKQINGIYEGDRINPEDDFAKQILIEDEREKIKKRERKKEEPIINNRFGNLLSAITWGSNGAITPFNRSELHIYDLVDGMSRTDKLLNYNHTMTGLYSGCVDKDKLDFQKISWQT